MRKTKIICTIGPAVDNPEMLEELMKAGMNVARINFSHGNYEDQKDRIETIKKVRAKLGKPVALLLDTKGPEIRIGKFADPNGIELKAGDVFRFVNEDIDGDKERISVSYKNLYKEISVGTVILINDGTIGTIQNTSIQFKIQDVFQKLEFKYFILSKLYKYFLSNKNRTYYTKINLIFRTSIN